MLSDIILGIHRKNQAKMKIKGLNEIRVRNDGGKGFIVEVQVQKLIGKYWEVGILKDGLPVYYKSEKEAIDATLQRIKMDLIHFWE